MSHSKPAWISSELTCLAAQHTVWEAQELAQHANCEAREDHHDAMQTFEGHCGTAKLEDPVPTQPDESRQPAQAPSFLGPKQEEVG